MPKVPIVKIRVKNEADKFFLYKTKLELMTFYGIAVILTLCSIFIRLDSNSNKHQFLNQDQIPLWILLSLYLCCFIDLTLSLSFKGKIFERGYLLNIEALGYLIYFICTYFITRLLLDIYYSFNNT